MNDEDEEFVNLSLSGKPESVAKMLGLLSGGKGEPGPMGPMGPAGPRGPMGLPGITPTRENSLKKFLKGLGKSQEETEGSDDEEGGESEEDGPSTDEKPKYGGIVF